MSLLLRNLRWLPIVFQVMKPLSPAPNAFFPTGLLAASPTFFRLATGKASFPFGFSHCASV